MIALIAEYRRRRSPRRAPARSCPPSPTTSQSSIATAWSRTATTWAAEPHGANPFTAAKPGERWLPDSLDRVPEDVAEIARVRDALGAALGREAERTLECDWRSDGERRSSHLRLCRLERRAGGAVVAHLDVTASKRLEIEARRALHELAHLNMRAGMGELVSAVTTN